jgi:Tfp pilus assembly PilM family ATPase
MIRSKRYSPIGLDAGARAVKAVQLLHTSAGPRIHAVAGFPRITPGEALNPAEILRAAAILRRQGFVGDRVVVSIPAAQMLSGVVELPARSGGAPLDAIARQELARACRKDPAAIELSWWELPCASTGARVAQSTQAIALGCTHADADALLACFDPAGMDVLAIDARPTCIARACTPLLAPAPNLTAILDLGYGAAHILILSGPTLVYERTLAEASLRLLASGVANQLSTDDVLADYILRVVGCRPFADVPDAGASFEQAEDARAIICAHADAIAGELRTSMSYATRRFDGELSRIILCGAGADIPGLSDRLAQRTSTEAIIARLDVLVDAPVNIDPALLGPGATVALGLALHDAPASTRINVPVAVGGGA